MEPLPDHTHAAVRSALDFWHDCVARRDTTQLHAIVHPQAVFRSPMAFKPYSPAPAVVLVLSTALQVFEHFTYHRQFVSADGLNVVLEFSAEVNGRELKGIDMIRFDTQGMIVEFEVMIRPFSGLQALGEEMGRRLAPVVGALKP